MGEEKLPFVTVVVATCNRYRLLLQCLTALRQLDYPEEKYMIIVVDDGSRDETSGKISQMESFGRRYKYVRLEDNQGVSAARNCGIRMAEGDLIAFTDDDCVVQRDWLRLIAETFSYYPEAGAVGGSILNPQDIPLAWASYILDFSAWLPVGRVRSMRDIPGCNIAYRRSDITGLSFRSMGKSTVYEDSIFNYQLRARKKFIIFNPRIKVYHYRSQDRLEKQGFLKSQQRYGRGFIRGGFLVHGMLGKLLFYLPSLNLVCPRLLFVFIRCLRSRFFLKKFIATFSLIISGEKERNKKQDGWNPGSSSG